MQDQIPRSHSCWKRNAKHIKAQEGHYRFVLGHDIYMDRVSTVCTCALIGSLEYARMNRSEWIEWENLNWKPLINYVPTISLLSRGWIVFVFLEEAHCSQILEGIWHMGSGSLVLDRWHPRFDPLKERIAKRHLWVLLPHLPFPLWNKNVLEGIANTIERFVSVEPDFLLVFDKIVAKVLVEMDISSRLLADVKILCGEHLIIQKLD